MQNLFMTLYYRVYRGSSWSNSINFLVTNDGFKLNNTIGTASYLVSHFSNIYTSTNPLFDSDL